MTASRTKSKDGTMRAIILAGGKGVRLHPYTTVFPKPLVPLGHKPIIEIIVRQLVHHGFRDIVLTTGYLAELIQAYFDPSRVTLEGGSLDFVTEAEPTGTAGSLAHIGGLDDTFLVINGDVLTDLDYGNLVAYHRKQGAALTVAVQERPVDIDFGVLDLGDDNVVLDYREKPRQHHMVSMGVYVYEPHVVDFIEPNTYLDFPTLVLRLLENGERVVAYPSRDYWLDIGRHEDYARAQEEFEKMKSQLLPGGD